MRDELADALESVSLGEPQVVREDSERPSLPVLGERHEFRLVDVSRWRSVNQLVSPEIALHGLERIEEALFQSRVDRNAPNRHCSSLPPGILGHEQRLHRAVDRR